MPSRPRVHLDDRKRKCLARFERASIRLQDECSTSWSYRHIPVSSAPPLNQSHSLGVSAVTRFGFRGCRHEVGWSRCSRMIEAAGCALRQLASFSSALAFCSGVLASPSFFLSQANSAFSVSETWPR